MSAFYRHPIGLLAYTPHDPCGTQNTILNWCVFDVGNSAFGHLTATELTKEAQAKDMDAFKDLKPRTREELLAFLGAELLGVQFSESVSGVAAAHFEANRFLKTVSEAARRNKVNVSGQFFWDCLHTLRGRPGERSLGWREYRILCALLSKIGSSKFKKCGWQEIQARSAGWCGKTDMRDATPIELERRQPLILTRDKIRTSLDRLEADNFFARLAFGIKAGETWFSFSCGGERKQLVEWVTARKARRAKRLIELRRDDAGVSMSIQRLKERTSPTNPQRIPNINQEESKIPTINGAAETEKSSPPLPQDTSNQIPKPSPTLTIEQELTKERQLTKERALIPATDGEEGYEVDGVFIPITQVNEFAMANRDSFLEITRRARRARRAKDGTVTLVNK